MKRIQERLMRLSCSKVLAHEVEENSETERDDQLQKAIDTLSEE